MELPEACRHDGQDIEIKTGWSFLRASLFQVICQFLLPDELEADVHRNTATVHVGDVC